MWTILDKEKRNDFQILLEYYYKLFRDVIGDNSG